MTPPEVIKRMRIWARKIVLVPGGAEASKAPVRAKENPEQLLPGIPDEVSLKLIVPKLPWRALCILSSTSCAWLWAIQSCEVYHARISSHSTETFVALLGSTQVALYSMRYNYCLELPPIPLETKNCWRRCASLDGKLYIFAKRGKTWINSSSVDVYVLDLTGQKRQWKRCGSMQEPRYGVNYGQVFGYGAKDGKLYVFRPEFSSQSWEGFVFQPGFTSDVYDFKSHSWSPRKPMLSRRYDFLVTPLGEEFLVYHGKNFDRRTDAKSFERALEVYNPLKDEWRVVGHMNCSNSKVVVFTAGGKIYAMDYWSISVHDPEKQSWRKLYMCRYPGIGNHYLWPLAVVEVNDELIASLEDRINGLAYLVRSRGFASQNSFVVWEKVELPVRFAKQTPLPNYYFMAPVQL